MSRIGSSPKAPPQRTPPRTVGLPAKPRPPQRPSQPRPVQRPPVRGSVRGPVRPYTQIDQRENPRVRFVPAAKAIGRGGAAAVFMDMSNVASDQTLGAVSPRAFNPKVGVSPDWGPEMLEPVSKGRAIVGGIIRPVDVPVLPPMPIEIPDAAPDFDPVTPVARPLPMPRPRPDASPVEVPHVPAVDRFTGIRTFPPARPKTQYETTIVIERVPGDKPGIKVRARTRFKYQIYQNTRRKYDAKGVYLRLQQLVTATFGTLTELQDFIEAVAVNIVDAEGRPVIFTRKGEFLDRSEAFTNPLARGAAVNFLGYYEAFDGLIDGRYSLDLGGFAFDYTMMQAGDVEAALPGRAMQKAAKALGIDQVMGVDAMLSMHRRLAGLPRQQRESYVWELRTAYRSAFAQRVFWSKRGLRSAL